MNSLTEVQKLLRKSVEQKKLLQIIRYLKQIHIVGGGSNLWGNQLVSIFLLLTDNTPSNSSLQRTALVSKIFKITIQSKMFEFEFVKIPENLKVTVSRIIKTLQFFFRQTTSGRQIKNQELTFIHSCIGKFMSALNGNDHNSFDKPKFSLSKTDEQKLSLIFPIPAKSNEGAKFQFIYPDLIQWYGFYLEIQNYMRFYDLEEEDIDIQISKFKQKDIVAQPILKWIANYYFMKESSEKYSQNSHSFDIKQHALRLIISLMTEVRVNFIIYLDASSNQKRDNDYYQNVLKVMVRFNSILLCYNLIQNIQADDNLNLVLATISEMYKSIQVILVKCQNQLNLLKKQESGIFVFSLIQYQRQLRWIVYHLKRKENLLRNSHNQDLNFLRQSQGAFSCLIKNCGLVSKKKLTQFVQDFVNIQKGVVLKQQLLNLINDVFDSRPKDYQSQTKKLNLVCLMAQLMKQKCHFSSYFNSVSSLEEEVNCLKICVSLLTKYHFNQVELILGSFYLSKKIMSKFFNLSEPINFDNYSEQINLAILVLNLSQKYNKSYICSHCQLLQPSCICSRCQRSCSSFIFPTLSMDFERDLKQYLDLYQETREPLLASYPEAQSRQVTLLLQIKNNHKSNL